MAKWNSDPSQDMLVAQDLALGEGQAVDSGDALEMVLTGWLLQNHTTGEVTHILTIQDGANTQPLCHTVVIFLTL